MHSTHNRREHIHGMLLGVAIGEALGYARDGLSSRTALKLYGTKPIGFRFLPKKGIYGDNTRLTFLNAQALLNSRSDLRSLRSAFGWRLGWYLLSVPYGSSRAVMLAAAKSWLRRFKVKPGVRSTGCGANGRAIFSALAMHGTGHRIPKWTEESTKLTHTHPITIDACKVLATLAEIGAVTKKDELNHDNIFEAILEVSTEDALREKLVELQGFLAQNCSPRAVAKHFGWKDKVPEQAVPVAVMATYCWLRAPADFVRAVESAILLGGASASLGATVGALVGAHAGQSAIPEKLEDQMLGIPHGPDWIDGLAERYSHWPHGADDLHLAPAQISDPPVQLMRNLLTFPIGLAHLAYRWSFRFIK